MKRKGRLREARTLLEEELSRGPGDEAALLVLAELQLQLGDATAGRKTLELCLEEHPDSPPTLRTLAVAELQLGHPRRALGLLTRSLARDPGDTRSWTTLVDALARVEGPDPGELDRLDPLVADCLEHEGVDPQELAGFMVRYLHRLPPVGDVLEALDLGECVDDRLEDPAAWSALDRRAVRTALGQVILPDLSVEGLTAALRRAALRMLAPGADAGPAARHLDLLVAVARNCHLTGFVHPRADAEARQVEALVQGMAGRPLGEDPLDPHRVALLASHASLTEWNRTPEVLDAFSNGWAPELQPLLFDQVIFPARELEYLERIPVLDGTGDPMPEELRARYDLNPCPRWARVRHRSPLSLAEFFARVFPWREVPGTDGAAPPRILVAGCGTGRRPLRLAGLFARSTVVGVDLSLARLAFATRKALEAGSDAVSFLQADILALEGWDERFDVVEAVDVLHHLVNPEEGWRILAGLVRPGGFMKVGLCPGSVRAVAAQARELTRRSGWDHGPAGVRATRAGLIRRMRGTDWGEALLGLRDFYSLDDFRDLVLHPRADPFGIHRIQGVLDDLGLEFLGFENVAPEHRARVAAAYGGADALGRLDAWVDYEARTPDVFPRMCEFWARKPA